MNEIQPINLIELDEKKFFEEVESNKSNAIVLREDDDYSSYWKINFLLKGRAWNFLISTPKTGLKPQFYDLDKFLGVGFGEWFYFLNGAAKKYKLKCRFYSLICVKGEDAIISHEIGFASVNVNKGVNWDKVIDLMNKFELVGNEIRYETFEGKKGTVKI